MSETSTTTWTGASGKTYKHYVYPLPRDWNFNFKAKAGNYIFAKVSPQNFWKPVYIGQTSDLSERFDDHHARTCITRNGATHIHVHTNNAGEAARRDEETDLIQAHDTPCNKT